jgi:glycosyltransferase involved in cell wall biosynthesis
LRTGRDSKQRVGIDASRVTSTSPTGTEGYSYHLLRSLLPKLRNEYEITLYYRQTPSNIIFPDVHRKVMPFPRLWTHLRLSWEMVRHRPDMLFVPAHVLPVIHPHKSLVTVHDVGFRYFPDAHLPLQRIYLNLSTRWNVKKATHIAADSSATREAIMREYNVPLEKISVVYPGYDSNLQPTTDKRILSDMRSRYGIKGDYVLHIGRIHPRKNLARLFNAFVKLLSEYPDLQLVLAGPVGWRTASLFTKIQENDLGDHVVFPGYVAEVDKSAIISGARILGYPSLYEGFGFPVLEAQACGTPVLTSSTSSLPEVAGDGALIVDPEDEDAISNGLKKLMTDDDLRVSCVEKGYQNLLRFSWDKTADRIKKIIDDLI